MKICIDPGHGKNTPGKRSPDGAFREYEFNRAVAKRLKHHLERHGVSVFNSCDIESPVDTPLADRCKNANNAKADYYVSIHANAAGTGAEWMTARGWEIFYCAGSTKGRALAESIQKASIPFLGLKDRGIKTNGLYVTKHTNMPAVLIEHGFYDNKAECELLKTTAFREKCAIADAKGILQYIGIPWTEEQPSNQTTETKAAPLTSANDIAWELDHTYFPIDDMDGFVKVLDKAKAENSPLYWGYYKLVNRRK